MQYRRNTVDAVEQNMSGQSRGGQRRVYTPPSDIVDIDSSVAGIKNGLLLRFPKLYIVGDLSLLELPIVAIVGARHASKEGRRRAAKLARELVAARVVVASGLALGIDEAAHEATLEAGGRTIAVIGTPVDKAYPNEHAELQRRICEQHLLISPFAIGTKTYPSHFPERNRVMARIARASVIIEASDTSGSLHQAVECVDANRHLFIAKNVIDNAKITWPKRFLGNPNVHVLTATSEVLEQIL